MSNDALKDAQGRDLNLTETAANAARMLKSRFPFIQFTSGRREVADQARAMAQNIVRNRTWILRTYRLTDVSRALQEWVNAHPGIVGESGIAQGLESVMGTFTPAELVALSRHLDGRAFDVQPIMDARAAAVKLFIKGLPGLDKFLDHEGGLVRWHLQFT